ncbi:sensor histidine kinase [Undibacterium fentianense]|uniref:Histidine kinase n=1 Tax=Undibacterium fentianense TaxID=2828728 RepID=A0A941E418_9BURK|nr:YwiC-like family protein [Undibacterium fentianense]MBR7800636.1 histidine kinase [Undibacterium fentianense]
MNTQQSTPNSAISEQALPAEVSIQSDTWLNRYRNFPVFSRTWFRHRSIAFGGTLFAALTVLSVIVGLTSERAVNFVIWTVPFFVAAFGLFLIGQAIAVWIRQQNYSERKESFGIFFALVLGMLLSFAIGYVSHLAFSSLLKPSDKKTEISVQAQIRSVPNEKSGAAPSAGIDNRPQTATPESRMEQSDAKKNQDRGPVVNLVITIVKWMPIAIGCIYWGSFFDFMVFLRQRKRLAEAIRQQELKRAQDARREAELRLSVLVAQVEPHFLFNTLAGVRSAILTEPLRATAIVDHLVDYLRSTIPQMRGDGSTEQGRLARQLEAARAYLGLMQARIPRLTFSVESELRDAAFPPLLLISLVENAIKHGIEPKIGPAHIDVIARYFDAADEEKLEVIVNDNGVGFGGTTSGSGIGLANIRERLESMYGDRASLTLKARPEGGVSASIIVPLLV